MTDAPERIWADGDETGLAGFCDWLWVRGSWNRSKEGVGEVEYVRADLVEAMEAENQRLLATRRRAMTDIKDNPDLASDLSAIAMHIIKSSVPDIHGELQMAFAAALAPMEAENQRLREALAPFGNAADHAIEAVGKTVTLGVLGALAPYYVTWQDFNRARAALNPEDEP